MSVKMLGFVLSEAWRDVRRTGRVGVSAVVLVGFSLLALGGFWVLTSNLGRAVVEWRDRVRVVVYLKREPTASELPALMDRVGALDGIASAVYVGKADALSSLRGALGKDATVLDHLPSNPLPASLAVTPTEAAATPDGTRALLARLGAIPEADEVVGGLEWVERLAHWRRLLEIVGLGVGAVLAVAAILTVTTATTLVLEARQQETEIMRLVGAAEIVIRLPLLLQGMFQGFVGGLLALAILVGVHRVAAPHVDPVLALTIGLPHLDLLPVSGLATLVAVGAALGGLGGYLARGAGR
jgi:cell division transport system permease protein